MLELLLGINIIDLGAANVCALRKDVCGDNYYCNNHLFT